MSVPKDFAIQLLSSLASGGLFAGAWLKRSSIEPGGAFLKEHAKPACSLNVPKIDEARRQACSFKVPQKL
jgi:hypothetical protein